MRTSRAVLCLVALGFSTGAFAQAPPRDAAPQSGTSAVRGRVVVAGDGRPLSRVEVRALNAALKVNKAVLTDANGRYEIAELPAGRYTVVFVRVNYVRAAYGQKRPLGPGATIDIASGQVVARIDAALQRSGVVTGRILDEFGDPVTGAQVMPMRYSFVNGERRMQPFGRGGFSNDLGEYRIYGLAPGRYFIAATFRNFGFGDTSDRSAYTPTYYPGTGNVAEAQRLTIAPGQTITGINMTLLPAVAVRISGTALDGRGRPLAGAHVNVAQHLGASMFGSSSSQVRPDGTFTIGGVTPGDYTLRAWLPGAPDETATADITVANADVNDVQMVAVKPSTLRGRVVFEAGDAKPPVPAAVRVNAIHPNTTSAMAVNDTPKDDWTFEIKSSAGYTILRAGNLGSGDWRVKRVLTTDGADVTDAGFDVPMNATVEGLVVEMTSRHSEVSGTVVDAAGASVRDCVVVLFAQNQIRWTTQTRYFGISRPDQDNVYTLRVPAGDYYAVAFEQDDPMVSLNDPEILQQLRDRATKVTIGDAEKKTLALTLTEPPIY